MDGGTRHVRKEKLEGGVFYRVIEKEPGKTAKGKDGSVEQ